MDGYGLLAVYKSDWICFGGKFKENHDQPSQLSHLIYLLIFFLAPT